MMTENTDKPKPRRRRKRVLSWHVMISMSESLHSAMERIVDETGVPLSEVERWAIRFRIKEQSVT